MLGMITAFAECLAGEAKKLAFSPPFYPEDYKSLRKEAEQICREQGVLIWYEENAELPADKRVHSPSPGCPVWKHGEEWRQATAA